MDAKMREVMVQAIVTGYEVQERRHKPRSTDYLVAKGKFQAYCDVLFRVFDFGKAPWSGESAILFAINKAPNYPVYFPPGQPNPRIKWLDDIAAEAQRVVD